MSTPRKLLQALTVLCFLASACASAKTTLPTTVVAASTATQTPRPISTLTATQHPTDIPGTPTLIPPPTIPSRTPTFDVRTIVTVTPARTIICPLANTNKRFINPTENPKDLKRDYRLVIEDFLDHGGSLEAVETELEHHTSIRDLTNDGIPELTLNDGLNGVLIFGCNPDTLKYQLIHEILPSPGLPDFFETINIEDLNLNGIPEIVVFMRSCGGGNCGIITIIEWGEHNFNKLIKVFNDDGTSFTEASIHYARQVTTQDSDNNGTIDVIWEGGIGKFHFPEAGPWRLETHTFMWNGENYVENPIEFEPARFRFQSIQDADRFVISGNYQKAFTLYQDAIFSDKLDWWSTERDLQQIDDHDAHWMGLPTPTLPAPNPIEYPRLAAYAYYRMIILHTHLGQSDAASIQYATLQEKFPAESPGHPYAEMASVFWDIYRSSQDMTAACGAAIQYAAENPDILTVLGSDYHGWQSHTYVPADVCPFR